MNRFCAAALLLMSCFVMPAAAVIETYEFSNEELEQRYQDLSAELRCPKCQNQNIADSNASVALPRYWGWPRCCCYWRP